jgi:hypothetical protein
MLSRLFYFRLAACLKMPVGEMLARIDSSELCEWAAYYLIEPFGQEWAQTARAAATVAWVHGNKDVEEQQFLPAGTGWRREKTVEEILATEVQSEEDMKLQLMKLGARFKPKEPTDGG